MNLTKIAVSLAAMAILTGCNKHEPQGASSDAAGVSRGQESVTNAAGQAPDNTGVNVRDRNDATLTPGDQGASETDRKLTSAIRRTITSNDQLSTTAKNIKIITVEGKVTLRGPVNSAAEKETIAAIVKQFGVNSVDNQLETKTTNQ